MAEVGALNQGYKTYTPQEAATKRKEIYENLKADLEVQGKDTSNLRVNFAPELEPERYIDRMGSLERTPKYDMVDFSKREQPEVAKKEKSGVGKKIATTVASAVLPGLGQAINGQWGKAAGFALGAPIVAATAFLVNPMLGGLVAAGLQIANLVDAYKNA